MSKALIFRCAAVLALAAVTSFVYPPKISVAEEPKTLKERLSDKASDDQRVDNCRVPPERRGKTSRPDCPTQSRPPMPAAQMDMPPTR